MRTVLVIHQSSELYGSDKVLHYLFDGLEGRKYRFIVILPSIGPLKELLESSGIEVHVSSVAKISRALFTLRGVLSLPGELRKGVCSIDRIVGEREIACVYSNTVAVLVGAVWALLRGRPHLWHIHEIVERPRFVSFVLRSLVALTSDLVIANSNMTKAWLRGGRKGLDHKAGVIWNGLPSRPVEIPDASALFRQAHGINQQDRVVCLVGRINKWKGQAIFIEAAGLLWARGIRQVRFCIVGSVVAGAEGDLLLQDIQAKISESVAREAIMCIDFVRDVWKVWDVADVAVVPSTEPEPFGMVAIEAMASGLPVVASGHGGLVEIVEDGVTGFLVPPSNATALADRIEQLLNDEALRSQMGAAGVVRQKELFSLDAQVAATSAALDRLCSVGGA